MESQDIPLLLTFLYGDKAPMGRDEVSERLLRWCQAFDAWLAARQRDCHPLTFKNSRFAWKQLLSQVGKPPWKISQADMSSYVEWLQEQGRAPGTIRLHLGAISGFYSWCAERGVDPECSAGFDPVKSVTRPKVRRYANAQVLSREEACALLAVLKLDDYILTRRDYAFFLARLRMGVPVKELLEMQWRQIEGGRGTGDRGPETGDGAAQKGGSQIAPLQEGVAIPEDVRRAILDYLRAAGRLEGIRAEDYIFAPLVDPLSQVASGKAEDWDGTRYVSSKRMRETLKTFGRAVGIPDEKLTLQALCHTAVMLRLEAGDSTEQIQAFLNRADLKATRRYLSLLPAPSLPTSCAGDEPAALPRPPERKPKPFQPGDNFRHGFYAQSHPPEEIAAMLAQDIRGMAEELEGLRVLERGLVEMQSRATSAAELAALVDAQSLAAARLVEMAKTEKERQAQRPEDSWGERMLAMEVDYARAQGEDIDIDTARQQVLAQDAEAQAAWRLMEEIAATRLGLRRIFNIAMETQEVKDRIHLTDIYARCCTRLVKLLKAEGRKHSRLDAVMSDALHQALTEIYEEFGLS